MKKITNIFIGYIISEMDLWRLLENRQLNHNVLDKLLDIKNEIILEE